MILYKTYKVKERLIVDVLRYVKKCLNRKLVVFNDPSAKIIK